MKVDRYYLEILSLKKLNEVSSPNKDLIIEKINPPDIEINKFFYKNVGKKHRWVDRLEWDNLKWISYLENEKVDTYVLKSNDNLVGYFEAIKNEQNNSTEIAYFGIIEEFIGKGIGAYLLSEAIKICFQKKSKRIYFKQKNIPKSKNTVIIFLIMLFFFLSILFFS